MQKEFFVTHYMLIFLPEFYYFDPANFKKTSYNFFVPHVHIIIYFRAL